jgi:hypothetical protein
MLMFIFLDDGVRASGWGGTGTGICKWASKDKRQTLDTRIVLTRLRPRGLFLMNKCSICERPTT